MQFTFPDNKTIQNSQLKNYRATGTWFSFTDIDIQHPLDNTITLDNIDYIFTYLAGAIPGNKGGNSLVLKLYDSQSIDPDNIDYDTPDLILKISKFKKAPKEEWMTKSEKRFLKEIHALKECKEKNFQNVIKLYHDGECSIKNFRTDKYEKHLFYTMEPAQFDLKQFIEINHSSLSLDEKLSLCISICEGINELYSLGYYHRDIKPDNIFIVGDDWKVGDLGLVDERKKDNTLDSIGEIVGPRGWLSPEAMNKYLCENKGFEYNHDCVIDHQSDIFQLGKLFWYIFQYNAPIGEVKERDFFIRNSLIFSVLKTMLRHSKKARYNHVEEIIKLFKLIEYKILTKAA